MCDKGIMLLRSDAGKRLEPVCKVRCTVLHSPVFHGLCHNICRSLREFTALFHYLLHFLKYILGKPLPHLAKGKDVSPKQFFNINIAHFSLLRSLLYVLLKYRLPQDLRKA